LERYPDFPVHTFAGGRPHVMRWHILEHEDAGMMLNDREV